MTDTETPAQQVPTATTPAELATNPSRAGVRRMAGRFARPHRRRLTVAVALGLAASLTVALGPVIVGRVADALVDGDRRAALTLAGFGVGLVAARTGLTTLSRAELARAGELVVRDIRDRVALQLATAPLRQVEGQRAGELLQRATAEVAGLSSFVRDSMTNLLATGSTVVLFLVVLATQSWVLTVVVVAVFLPPSLLVLTRFRSQAAAAFGAEAQAEAEVAATMAEAIRARSIIARAPARTQQRMSAEADLEAAAAISAQMRTVVLGRWINAMPLIEGLTLIAVIAVGTNVVGQGRVSVGVVVTFVLASVTLFVTFADLVALVGAVEETFTLAARVDELLVVTAGRGAAMTSDSPGQTVEARQRRAAVELDGVWFGYGDEPVLQNVGLRLERGRRFGLAGRTGAGKSTLATLIAGLYHPDRGQVRGNGVDLATLSPDERSRLVAYVPQEVVLGSATLADELRLAAPDATDEELRAVIGALSLAPWVDGLPAGLNTPVGETSSLTTGERQLVGLIRVALRGSEVILLDEATSDLDPSSAELVERALDELAASRTVVVVAHRESTLARMDVIYDVADGTARRRE
ncbi:MAG: ABC transporter ATP-binding protein [Acidimicrobiales bacterium]